MHIFGLEFSPIIFVPEHLERHIRVDDVAAFEVVGLGQALRADHLREEGSFDNIGALR